MALRIPTGAASSPRSARRSRTSHRPVPPSPFATIACAVDGSRGSREALHQAIALCGRGTALRLIAVREEEGNGLASRVGLTEMRAREVLEASLAMAREAGVQAAVSLLRGGPPGDLLLAEAAAHDLLVIGCHGGPRVHSLTVGGTAMGVAHRARRPVLVARRGPNGNSFPRSILIATDGSPGSWAAARLATAVSQAKQAELRLVYVPDGMHPERYREVLKQLTVIERATGCSPAVVDDPGHVAARICEAVVSGSSSLLVIGHRGLAGIRSLGSVSDRVVRKAECSVLVAPALGSVTSQPAS